MFDITARQLGLAAGVVLFTLFIRFWIKLHTIRTRFKGLPGPPHSYLWGSLRSMGEVLKTQPTRAAPQTFPSAIKDYYKLGDYFYLDPWPFGPGFMCTFDPGMMNDFTVKQSMRKHPEVDKFMQNFGGAHNLVSSEGAEWKKWRSVFNPGFSGAHLMTMVPMIVDEVSIFSSIMQAYAEKNELFRMEQATTRLTVDIIGKVILDTALNSQKGPNELVDAFNSQVRWQKIGAQFQPSELWDIRRPIIQRWNNWRMDRYIGRCIDDRFASRASRSKQKHVVDLALEAYLKEVKGTSGDISTVKSVSPEFKVAAIANVKTFIFAGHDTTSSTICYCYYYASKNSDILRKIRQEHDEVFGPDSSTVAQQLKDDPRLLNKLDYTLAVTREVLRIQPPASTVRVGQKGFFLHDPKTGEPLPTEDIMLWPVDVGIHRNEEIWGDPHTFRPERHLPGGDGSKDAWVAFSKGVRNCIGQELAIIETKVILAMTIRSFDFESAYGELEKLKNDGSGYPSDVHGVQKQFGEEAYQIQLGTAKPREGMPCRLRLRK